MPIQIRTIDGFPLGHDLAKPVNDVDDNHARYLQDFLLDEPTLTTMRGPVKSYRAIFDNSVDPHRPVGVAQLETQAVFLGTNNGSGAELITFSTSSGAALSYINLGGDFTANGPKPYFVGRPALTKQRASWLGAVTTPTHTGANGQLLALWGAASFTGSVSGSGSVVRGSTSFTTTSGGPASSWVGAFVYALEDEAGADVLIGQIKSVSGTTITLYDPSPWNVTAKAYSVRHIRAFHLKVSKGRLTTSTTATTVTGSNTKFKDQGLASGNWYLFKRDGTYIGKVSSVATNTGLVLTANAAVALSNENYVAIKREHWTRGTVSINTYSDQTPGWISAVYANRQWFASRSTQISRVWFSDPADPEMLDLSTTDGDFFEVTSTHEKDTPILQLFSTTNTLLVLKQNELYGVFGNTPSSFSVRRLGDQGCLCPMSVQGYGGGVLWAGKKGIFYYNGAEVENIVQDSLGDEWEQMVRDFDVSTDRMYGTVYNNHYFLFLDTATPTRGVKKLGADTIPTALTVAINLRTRAVTYLTNCFFVGAIDQSPDLDVGGTFLVPTTGGATQVYARELFHGTGLDDVTTYGQTAGPKPYIESKKYDMDDPQIKKLIKQVQMLYKSAGDTVTLETITGLNETGSVSVSTFVAQATYANKRIKFLKRSQYLAFRLYATNNTMTQLVIGPIAVGFKYQRPGRI
jgi:hypothetical protein